VNEVIFFRAMNPGGLPQTIKIQTIQTNPQTGAKQIVAIPIQVKKIIMFADTVERSQLPLFQPTKNTFLGGGCELT
jgi:hypothetical protein